MGLMMDSSTRNTLDDFLETELKYEIAPVPAHLDRNDVAEYVADALKRDALALDELQLTVRLAKFFGLRPAVADYAEAQLTGELAQEQLDIARIAVLIDAIAWLGSEDQRTGAHEQYDSVVQRANWTQDTEPLWQAAFELGTDRARESLQSAAAREASRVSERLEAVRESSETPVIDALENHQAALEEFAAVRMAALARANAVRNETNAEPWPGRAASLVSLYLETADEATPELGRWAGFSIALDRANADRLKALRTQFVEAINETTADPDPDSEATLVRARALRAAILLGWQPDEDTLLWLAQLDDYGVDLLASRPWWEYAARSADDDVDDADDD